jgi:REP-associated tyrosine transposase
VPLYSQKVVEQKINYIHGNPINPKWSLADEPQGYKYSSARFYYTGEDEFACLPQAGIFGKLYGRFE